MTLAFSCVPDVFRRLVGRMGKTVDLRSTAPVLRNLKIEAVDGRLTVTGTSGGITAIATSAADEVEIASPGATTIPNDVLRDFLRKLGKREPLQFKSGGAQAEIRCGGSTFRPFEIPADDFPESKPLVDVARLGPTPAQLRRIAGTCGFAISTDEAKYTMCGIYLHVAPVAPGRLTSVATDGHKLSRLVQMVEGDLAAMPSVIVPRKTVEMFGAIADAAGEEPVAMEVTAERIALEGGDLRIVSDVIGGNFPDYARVLPASLPIRVQVERERLKNAIGRVAAVRSEKGAGMAFRFSAGSLALSMTQGDNVAHDEIEIEGGADLLIGFNATYALAALESFDTHGIEIALGDPGSPALLMAPGDDSRLALLMPMRV